MSLPATDNFNRGDSSFDLGANWTAIALSPSVVSNACRAEGSSNPEHCSQWTADSPNADHYGQCVMASPSTDALGGAGPIVRVGGSTRTTLVGYILGANSDVTKVYRVDAGPSYTAIATLANTYAANDVAKLSAEGSTIRGYKNGTQNGTDISDATYGSGGVGLFLYNPFSITGGILDDFEVGNLAAAAPVHANLGTFDPLLRDLSWFDEDAAS